MPLSRTHVVVVTGHLRKSSKYHFMHNLKLQYAQKLQLFVVTLNKGFHTSVFYRSLTGRCH